MITQILFSPLPTLHLRGQTADLWNIVIFLVRASKSFEEGSNEMHLDLLIDR